MKILPILLLLTLSTQAQIIHWPTQRVHTDYPPPITRDNYAQVHRQYPWLPDGLTGNIRNNTDLLASLEVYPLTEFATPTGMVKVAGTRTYSLVDGVVIETWQTETQSEHDARIQSQIDSRPTRAIEAAVLADLNEVNTLIGTTFAPPFTPGQSAMIWAAIRQWLATNSDSPSVNRVQSLNDSLIFGLSAIKQMDESALYTEYFGE